jgi:hypothetical protein
MKKQGQVKALTRRNSAKSVSVIQRDRSGKNRVRQTTVRRNDLSRVRLSRRQAIRVSGAATSRPGLRPGQSRMIVKTNRRGTRVAKRNAYLVTADT